MESTRKYVSVLTGCFNEEENVAELVAAVGKVFDTLPQYDYEHVFIDNSSTDRTVEILKEIGIVQLSVKPVILQKFIGLPFYSIRYDAHRHGAKCDAIATEA